MKKFTRILAVALTLCLLVGAFALVAAAAEPSQLDASQYGAGISNYVSGDFEDASVVSSVLTPSVGSGKLPDKTNVGLSTYALVSTSATVSAGGETNTYCRITNKVQENPALVECSSYPFYSFFVGAKGSSAAASADLFVNYDYATLDFDIAAMGEGGFLDGAYMVPYNINPSYTAYLYTVTDGENWYLSTKESYAAGGVSVKISSEIGVWTHITYIFDIKNASSKTLSAHVYVNGAHFHTYSVTYVPNSTDSSNLNKATQLERLTLGLSSKMGLDAYCYGVDNISTNRYAKGYTSQGYGIDDLLKDDPTASITRLSDVVYREGYTYLAPAQSQGYVVDGERYYIATEAAAALKTGSEITIYNNLHVDVKGVDYFIANTANGANVTLGSGIGSYARTLLSDNDGIKTYKYTKVIAEDREGYETAYHYDFSNSSFEGTTPYNNFNSNFKREIASLDGNSFIKFTETTDITLSKNAVYRFNFMKTGGSTTEELASEYEYQIIDFDFATDSNYYDGVSFTLYNNVTAKWPGIGGIYSDGQGGYVYANDSDLKTKAPIYSGANVWNHVTAVISPEGVIYVYLNGEFFMQNKTYTINESERVERLDVFWNKGTTIHDFSLLIDNVIVRNYKNGYNSGDVFGVDDYAALGDVKIPIYGLGDVVYGANYGYDSAFGVPTTSSSSTGSYHVPSGAFMNAKDGDTVTITKDVTLLSALPEHIQTLKVVGGNVTLLGDAARYYTYSDGVLAKNLMYTVNVYDGNGAIVQSFMNDAASAPAASAISADIGIKGDYKRDISWSFKVGDSEAKPLSEWTGAQNGDVVSLIPNTAIVLWCDTDGETLGEPETWFIGSKASRATDDLEDLGLLENGWYELAYVWTGDGEDIYDTTVNYDCAFVATIAPVEAFTGLKVNYTLGLNYRCNYYVPVPMDEEITVTGAKYAYALTLSGCDKGYFDDIEECAANHALSSLSGSLVNIEGYGDYYRYQGATISAYSWYTANGFELCFNVEYEGETYELTSKVAVTRLGNKNESAHSLNYLETVLNRSECGAGKDKALVLNWMRYINQSYKAQGTHVDLATILLALEEHADCGCLESLESAIPKTAPEYDVSGITSLIDGFSIGYRVSHTSGRLAVYIPKAWAEANADKNIEVLSTVYGIDNNSASFKNMTYSLILQTELDEKNSTEDLEVYVPTVTTVNGIECHTYLMTVDFGVYNVNATNNITIKLDDAAVASGSYSIAAYIYNLNEKLGLYKLDEISGEYMLDESKIDGAYTLDQLLLKTTLALAKLGEAAYDYKVN